MLQRRWAHCSSQSEQRAGQRVDGPHGGVSPSFVESASETSSPASELEDERESELEDDGHEPGGVWQVGASWHVPHETGQLARVPCLVELAE